MRKKVLIDIKKSSLYVAREIESTTEEYFMLI